MLWIKAWIIYVTQTNLITSQWCFVDIDGFSAILSFKIFLKFSVGLGSGLFPGHARTSTFSFSRYDVITFALWQGAQSRTNILLSWIFICRFNLSFNKLRYFYVHYGSRGQKTILQYLCLTWLPKSFGWGGGALWLRLCIWDQNAYQWVYEHCIYKPQTAECLIRP